MTNQTERENWRVQRNKRNRLIFESNRKIAQDKNSEDYLAKSEALRLQAQEVIKAREALERRQAKLEEEVQNEEGQVVQEQISQSITDNRLRRAQAQVEAQTTISQPQQKISSGSAYLLVGTAIFFDVFQGMLNVIPVIGQILSMFVTGIAWGTFKLWFLTKRVKFSQRKTVIIEIIPLINIIPVWTISVLIAIGKDRSSGLFAAVPALKSVIDKM